MGTKDSIRSFGQLVFGKAISDTFEFFSYTLRDLILGGVFLALGLALAVLLIGKADTMKEIVFMAVFTFAPLGIVTFAIFLWHLWLAPAAMAYEATREASLRPRSSGSDVPVPTASPVNWGIWRQMDNYTLMEFSAILARSDPSSNQTGLEQAAYFKAIDDDVRSGKLPYVKEYAGDYNGRYVRPIDSWTKIKKVDAIKWADSHEGFDVSHVR